MLLAQSLLPAPDLLLLDEDWLLDTEELLDDLLLDTEELLDETLLDTDELLDEATLELLEELVLVPQAAAVSWAPFLLTPA